MARRVRVVSVLAGALALCGCLGNSTAAAPPGPHPTSLLPTSATIAPTFVPQHRGHSTPADPFSKRIEHVLAHHRGTISAAALDLNTGRRVIRNGGVSVYTASIIKVAILLAAEERDRRQGHGLTTTQRSTAKLMIEASDNDAATTLWREGGKTTALRRLFQRLGMRHTGTAPTLFEPWDGITTTASDQLRLLRALATGLHGVTTRDRAYALHLMENVEPDQDWGVPTGTKPGWAVAVKNGWVPVGSHGWTVNTIGIVRGSRGDPYLLAIVTSGSASEAAGIRKLDPIARSVAHRWGRG